MRPNETVLKVSPLLTTPDETNQGRLAHRVRVSGVPTRATVAPFPASQLGVNKANQGQMGPRFNPLLVVPAQVGTSHPFRSLLPLGEG